MNYILFQLKENSMYGYYDKYDKDDFKDCSSINFNYLATFLIYDYKPYDISFLEEAILKNRSGHYDASALIIEKDDPNIYLCSEYDWDDYLEKHPNSNMSIQELFLEKKLNHFVMKKTNFMTILHSWNKNLQKKSPYIVLYQKANLKIINLIDFSSVPQAVNFLITIE